MNLAGFARDMMRIAFDGCDADGALIQEIGVDFGLLVETKYDPVIHGENSVGAEPGDIWYVFSDEFRSVLAADDKAHRE